MRRTSIFLIGLACFPALGLAAPVKTFELGACKPPLPPDARCGVYEVFENRAAKSGRKIPLQVVVLPATGPERLPDPIVYFAGGPGASSINEGIGFGFDTPELRKSRDFLLIDSRGTGQSAPLACHELKGSGSIQGFLEDYMPADKVRACLDRLRKTADPAHYSTDNVVDDAEEIRTALGYGQVNVMGTSYGTRTVQIYMRRHPRSVRTAVMSGVLSLETSFPFITARYSQQGLEGLLAECESDPACRKAFPKLREETAAVLRQVETAPVKVQVIDGDTGKPINFTLSKNGLGQVLRRMLYYNTWISITPLALHQAANGDWGIFAEFAKIVSAGNSTEGYYLSITCSEDLAFVREDEIPAAVAGTFLGDLRVRKQMAACVGWPAPKLGPEFRRPVASDVPALLLSGGADPATPPSEGEKVARHLKRSRHVVVPDGGHGQDGMKGGECVPQMITAFIQAGAAESLDTSCSARMQRPDFLLSLQPEVKLKPEELARLTGTWVNPQGMQVKTEDIGGYLRVSFPGDAILLAATSPTTFRLRNGETWLSLTFNVQDGRTASITLVDPQGTSTWTRQGS